MSQQPSQAPSAPPEHELVDENAFFDDFVQPSGIGIPDAIQQQIIYQQIMARQKSQSQSQSQAQPPSAGPGFTFPNMNKVLDEIEVLEEKSSVPAHSRYTSAGLCVWRPKEDGRGIELMLYVDPISNQLSLFHTPRQSHLDTNCIDTAVRAFHEQSGRKLDNDILNQMRSMLACDSDRRMYWKEEWLTILLFYPMSYDYDLVADNDCLHWVSFDKLYRSLYITGDRMKLHSGKRNKDRYIMDDTLCGLLLHRDNQLYLTNCFLKHGGLRQDIQPHKGGSIRTITGAFDHIPHGVRLDIIHPLTQQLLYHRWMNIDLLELEDYLVLQSLISSVCPEMNHNYMVYYSDSNGYMKNANQLHSIYSVPSLQQVKQMIGNIRKTKPSMRVVRLSIVPTFVIADSWKGISLFCKPKQFVPLHELHTRVVVSVQDGGMNYKQEDEKEVGYDYDYVQPWKWQFMNDNNGFQDLESDHSKHIERMFQCGHSFATFTRKKVSYQANLKTMYQKNLNTQRIRVLRRVPTHVQSESLPLSQPSVIKYHKWQYCDDDGSWKDYDTQVSKQLHVLSTNLARYYRIHHHHAKYTSAFTLGTKIGSHHYQIDVKHLVQQNSKTKKERSIRQVPVYGNNAVLQFDNNGLKYRWEWQDDDGTFKPYDNATSRAIEEAQVNGYKKYFFVSTKNNNSYEITFHLLTQYNVQSGKQRQVRRILLEPAWTGPGPNPKQWKGPLYHDRRTFDTTIIELYCVVGDRVAQQLKQCGSLMHGTLGRFGAGLYWYSTPSMAKQLAKDRNQSNKGNVVHAKVFVGKTLDKSYLKEESYNFVSLQQLAYDSVSRGLHEGKEYCVYNMDQVCIMNCTKYYHA